MVEAKRVHQSESVGFNASVYGWNKWEAFFDISQEQKRLSPDTIFCARLGPRGKSRSLQGLLESTKKKGGSQEYSRDN